MTKLMQYLKDNTVPKITAKELADKLGVHQSLINLWREGKRKPGTKTLKPLSKLTGIRIEDLL